jgi:predicted ChrR family anti-sigma factor
VISPPFKYAPFFDDLKQLWQLSEEQVQAVFETDRWRATPLLGVRVREVALSPNQTGSRARVTNFQAGCRFPRHTHRAMEQVLVLEGAYTDSESGVVYGPGDLHTMAPGTTHGLIVARHGRCIAASMHHAPFEFHSWPLRLLARLTGN